MHGGFSVVSGQVPYVDYFEHHTPWFGWLAARLIQWLGPDWDTLMAARLISGVLSVGALAVTWGIARTLASKSAALVALAIHATFLSGIDKGIEIRPDVPAALLFSLALALGARALRRNGGMLAAVLGGLSLGSGLMFTPKLAFGAIGLGAGSILFLMVHGPEVRRRLPRLMVFVAVSFLPAVLTALFLHRAGHFDAFFQSVVLGPLDWKREVSASVHLGEAVSRNPISMVLGALGLVAMFCRGMAFRKESPLDAEPLLFATPLAALSIFIGWFLVPVPWPQFLLPLWALLGIGAAQLIGRLRSGVEATVFFSTAAVVLTGAYGALGLSWGSLGRGLLAPTIIGAAGWIAVRFLPGRDGEEGAEGAEGARGARGARTLGEGSQAGDGPAGHDFAGQRLIRFAGLATALGLLLIGAYRFQPHALPWALAWGALALLIVMSPPEHRLRATALVFLLAGPLAPIARLLHDRPVYPFRAEFDAVMARTEPGDTVLTGWRGCAVFRGHAYRYFFLHKGVLQMLTDEERGADVIAALRASAPKAVVRDLGTRGLSEEVQDYLDRRYTPSGVGDLWFRVR